MKFLTRTAAILSLAVPSFALDGEVRIHDPSTIDQKGACASMNKIIEELPRTSPTAHFISSDGCAGCPDHLHFTPAGNRELGARYGLKMLSVLGYKSEASK